MKPRVILLLLALTFLLLACTTSEPTQEEQTWLITIDDIAATGVDVGTPSSAGAEYAARHYINGLTEVEYVYDSEYDPANSDAVYYFSEADVHRNEELAEKAFYDAIEAYLLGASFGDSDVDVVEIRQHIALGSQNYSANLELDGVKLGNLVVVQKGKLVYSLVLAGPVIKHAQTLDNLIGPKIDKVLK